MGVETATALPHLDKPRPDRRSGCADRNGHRVAGLGTWNYLIAWKTGVSLVVSRGSECVPREQRMRRYERYGESRRRPHTESNPSP
jgi:hypothetical protein